MQRRQERQAFARQQREVRKVRVTPKNDDIRRVLKHPRLGGFRSTGSIEWPLDTFTKRRIADGSVKVEQRAGTAGQAAAAHAPQPRPSPTSHSSGHSGG
jgi:hypothetical protein